MNKIKAVLIGGAPLTGKSTLINNTGSSIKVISADNIRNQMFKTYDKNTYPELFFFNDLSASECYEKYSIQEVLKAEHWRNYIIQEELQHRLIDNQDNCIIEGITITPSFVVNLANSYYFDNYDFEGIFLYDANVDHIRERLFKRGLWTNAADYSDEVKEKELELLVLYNQWYYKQAEKFGFKITPVK